MRRASDICEAEFRALLTEADRRAEVLMARERMLARQERTYRFHAIMGWGFVALVLVCWMAVR